MGHFDWQTEEEGAVALPVARGPAHRRRGWIAALMIIGIAGLAIVAYWQMGRQAKIRDEAVKEDVLAAYGVWRQAAIEYDVDLLDTLLLGGEPNWTATQRKLIETGQLFIRDDLGLILDEHKAEAMGAPPTIDLAANRRAAEITFPLTYQPVNRDPTAAGIELEQTVSLKRAGSRWLLQRPEEEFWGGWRTAAGELASITYRARDEVLADRLLTDLEIALRQECANLLADGECPPDASLEVRLESDPDVMFKLIDRHTPSFAGRTFILPSPTLVGTPLNDAGYEALYEAYSEPILATFAAMLAAPIQLPDQVVTMLCYSRYDNLPRLYSYDPAIDVWHRQLDGRSFRFLAADESDSSLVLRELLPGQPHQLRVVQWSGDRAKTRHDATYGPLTDHQLGWTGSRENTKLLLSSFQGTMRAPSYNLVETDRPESDSCLPSGCDLRPLDGFPVWSPDGSRSLIVNDGQVYLADDEGQAVLRLAEGHSPFWLNQQRYGFVRELKEEDRRISELVTGIEGDGRLSELWRADELDLIQVESSLAANSPVFIQHVVATPGQPESLLMYGRQYAGADSRYVFVSLPITAAAGSYDEPPIAGPAGLELALDGPPASIPSAGDPNGHRTFLISADGRWLTAGQLVDKGSDLWAIFVTEIGRDNVIRYSTHYPGFSFDQLFFDWSSDGRWFLIVDENFLRLVAPTLGYQRIIAHDHRSCSYPAWMNRPASE